MLLMTRLFCISAVVLGCVGAINGVMGASFGRDGPSTLPQLFQFEHFDSPGQSFSRSSTSSVFSTYRPDSKLTITTASYLSTQRYVQLYQSDWVAFTVTVPDTATYRVISAHSGYGPLAFTFQAVSGTSTTAKVSVPPLGTWSYAVTDFTAVVKKSVTVQLSQGTYLLNITTDFTGASYQYVYADWFYLLPAAVGVYPVGNPAPTIPGTIDLSLHDTGVSFETDNTRQVIMMQGNLSLSETSAFRGNGSLVPFFRMLNGNYAIRLSYGESANYTVAVASNPSSTTVNLYRVEVMCFSKVSLTANLGLTIYLDGQRLSTSASVIVTGSDSATYVITASSAIPISDLTGSPRRILRIQNSMSGTNAWCSRLILSNNGTSGVNNENTFQAAWSIGATIPFYQYATATDMTLANEGNNTSARPLANAELYTSTVSANGVVVGGMEIGEWLNFSINVTSSGFYNVSATAQVVAGLFVGEANLDLHIDGSKSPAATWAITKAGRVVGGMIALPAGTVTLSWGVKALSFYTGSPSTTIFLDSFSFSPSYTAPVGLTKQYVVPSRIPAMNYYVTPNASELLTGSAAGNASSLRPANSISQPIYAASDPVNALTSFVRLKAGGSVVYFIKVEYEGSFRVDLEYRAPLATATSYGKVSLGDSTSPVASPALGIKSLYSTIYFNSAVSSTVGGALMTTRTSISGSVAPGVYPLIITAAGQSIDLYNIVVQRQGPYYGSAQAIPATISAYTADYADSYTVDRSVGNSGDAPTFRADDVDTFLDASTSEGYVGAISSGEKLTYTLSLAVSQRLDVSFVVRTSTSQGATMVMMVNNSLQRLILFPSSLTHATYFGMSMWFDAGEVAITLTPQDDNLVALYAIAFAASPPAPRPFLEGKFTGGQISATSFDKDGNGIAYGTRLTSYSGSYSSSTSLARSGELLTLINDGVSIDNSGGGWVRYTLTPSFSSSSAVAIRVSASYGCSIRLNVSEGSEFKMASVIAVTSSASGTSTLTFPDKVSFTADTTVTLTIYTGNTYTFTLMSLSIFPAFANFPTECFITSKLGAAGCTNVAVGSINCTLLDSDAFPQSILSEAKTLPNSDPEWNRGHHALLSKWVTSYATSSSPSTVSSLYLSIHRTESSNSTAGMLSMGTVSSGNSAGGLPTGEVALCGSPGKRSSIQALRSVTAGQAAAALMESVSMIPGTTSTVSKGPLGGPSQLGGLPSWQFDGIVEKMHAGKPSSSSSKPSPADGGNSDPTDGGVDGAGVTWKQRFLSLSEHFLVLSLLPGVTPSNRSSNQIMIPVYQIVDVIVPTSHFYESGSGQTSTQTTPPTTSPSGASQQLHPVPHPPPPQPSVDGTTTPPSSSSGGVLRSSRGRCRFDLVIDTRITSGPQASVPSKGTQGGGGGEVIPIKRDHFCVSNELIRDLWVAKLRAAIDRAHQVQGGNV